jgi:hypothetical protein
MDYPLNVVLDRTYHVLPWRERPNFISQKRFGVNINRYIFTHIPCLHNRYIIHGRGLLLIHIFL